MSLHFPSACTVLLFALASTAPAGEKSIPATTQPATTRRTLHIAADPNNLPFTNERLEGFENKIASIVAKDIDADIEYTWWAQRRGFFRETVKHGECDVVLGVPADFERTLTSIPYYRSTYVFVYSKDKNLSLHTFDDAALRQLKIGVVLTGGDSGTPPATALARRNIIDNLVGFTAFGDFREDNPMSEIVTAVATGKIDVAVVWGPLGGYFAERQSPPLRVSPVEATSNDAIEMPFAFDICIGVKRGNKQLCDDISGAIKRHQREIDEILGTYNVPKVPALEKQEQSHATD